MAEQSKTESPPPAEAKSPVKIKKYANRRLYNTATSSYVTLDYLARLVKDGVEFLVEDAKTGEDITRAVLTQIIVEEEQKGQNLLPIGFLRQLISFYGDSLQFLLPRYLDQSMQSFARNQEQMRRTMQDSFGGMFPFANFEEMGRKNIQLMERAMQMFSPFSTDPTKPAATNPEGSKPVGSAPAGAAAPQSSGDTSALNDLKRQLDTLQRQIEALDRQNADKSK